LIKTTLAKLRSPVIFTLSSESLRWKDSVTISFWLFELSKLSLELLKPGN
ncbi:hypothetical protein LINPERHAP2_LOCUS29898, partial [Linum perenne]